MRRDEFNLVELEGFDLRHKTLGVVRTGHIGLRVIQIARGFSMRVLAHDPVEQPLLADMLGFAYLPLEDLLQQSDIVSLHAHHNRHTHHLIDSDTLERISDVATYAVPLEALYQHGLYLLTSDTQGLTGIVVQLGPFGGAQESGPWVIAWALAYTAAMVGLAVAAFRRRDL